MTTRTLISKSPDRQERETLVLELYKALPLPNGNVNYIDQLESEYPGRILNLHFTDWYGKFDLPMLRDNGLVEYLPYQYEAPVSDRFPLSAYHITDKAIAIIQKPNLWVVTGTY